jgi:hypothetical protein
MNEIYKQVRPGHLFQYKLTGTPPDYSSSYSKVRYDTYKTNDAMSELRYNVIKNAIGEFTSVLDFGYGNGAFLKHCESHKISTFGYDISDYPVPTNTIKVDDPDLVKVDVATFFDSMEHLLQEDLISFLQNKRCDHFCISVPWYHASMDDKWFKDWKHRRENEHIHHFDAHGLIGLLMDVGCKIVYVGNPEDKIRTPSSNLPNILTVIGTRKV